MEYRQKKGLLAFLWLRHRNCTAKGMAYVITDDCTKDELCVEVCPVNCIHPTKDEPGFDEVPTLYVHPEECIDCGACIPVCPTSAIMPLEDVPPEKSAAIAANAAWYSKN